MQLEEVRHGEAVHREGLPDVYRVPDEDKEMEKAVQKARASVDMFIAALKSRKPTQSDFSIKKPFKYGDQFEHIWLSNASFDGTQFHGRVDNDPVDVKSVKLGDVATAAKGEISDWFYVDNGKLVGGYTLRALRDKMSPEEKKDFDAHLDFKIE